MAPTSPVLNCEHASFSKAFPHLDVVSDHIASDFFDSNKKPWFLALEGSQFEFIGPDRDSPLPLSLSDYISMATTIRSTGLPNYRQARLPVHSNLNIQAWEKLLANSPNTRLFGLP